MMVIADGKTYNKMNLTINRCIDRAICRPRGLSLSVSALAETLGP
jgi:hypothetical protein